MKFFAVYLGIFAKGVMVCYRVFLASGISLSLQFFFNDYQTTLGGGWGIICQLPKLAETGKVVVTLV